VGMYVCVRLCRVHAGREKACGSLEPGGWSEVGGESKVSRMRHVPLAPPGLGRASSQSGKLGRFGGGRLRGPAARR
jgi:hypothetical protein